MRVMHFLAPMIQMPAVLIAPSVKTLNSFMVVVYELSSNMAVARNDERVFFFYANRSMLESTPYP